jgi:hypothetical protein
VKQLFDCPRATLFIFNKRYHSDFFDKVPSDKHRYLH